MPHKDLNSAEVEHCDFEDEQWCQLQKELRSFAMSIIAKVSDNRCTEQKARKPSHDSAMSLAAILSGRRALQSSLEILDASATQFEPWKSLEMRDTAVSSSSNSKYPSWDRSSFKTPEAFIKCSVA